MVNEVEVEDPNAQPDEEYVYTIDREVNVVDLSHSGWEVNKIKKRKQPKNGTQEQTAKEWDPRTNSQGMGPKNPRTNSLGMGRKNPRTNSQGMGPKNP